MDAEEVQVVEIRQYLGLLRRWLWLIVVGTVLAAGSAFAVSWLSTPIYEASTTLLINEGQKATGLDYNAILMSERLAKTYSQLLKGGPILDEARARLGLSADDLQLDVELVRDTQLIRLRARHADPALAAGIANTIPQIFIEQNGQMQSARFASSQESLNREMASLQARIEATQGELDAERAKALPDNATLARLDTLLAQYRTTYADLLRSYEEIRVAESRAVDTVIVVEPAKAPLQPVLPRTRTNTLLAAVVGAMLAVGAAFLIEYLDDTVKTADDVERAIQLPTFASIVRFQFSLNGEGPLMAAHPSSAITEAYRLLRTNLQFSTLGMGGSAVTLLFTSAGPDEGKTTTLANLGVNLAQIGKRVLLVDTDLRRPALHRQFALQNRAGLTSLFLDREADLARVIQETGVPGLRVLTAGPIPANPAEVLEFPLTTAVLEQLGSLADYVLLDSPPILSVVDASILAQKVDGVVLVAEAGKTRTDVLRDVTLALQRVKARVLGVVINKSTHRPGSYPYYAPYGARGAAGEKRTRGHRSPAGPHTPLRRALGGVFGVAQRHEPPDPPAYDGGAWADEADLWSGQEKSHPKRLWTYLLLAGLAIMLVSLVTLFQIVSGGLALPAEASAMPAEGRGPAVSRLAALPAGVRQGPTMMAGPASPDRDPGLPAGL